MYGAHDCIWMLLRFSYKHNQSSQFSFCFLTSCKSAQQHFDHDHVNFFVLCCYVSENTGSLSKQVYYRNHKMWRHRTGVWFCPSIASTATTWKLLYYFCENTLFLWKHIYERISTQNSFFETAFSSTQVIINDALGDSICPPLTVWNPRCATKF